MQRHKCSSGRAEDKVELLLFLKKRFSDRPRCELSSDKDLLLIGHYQRGDLPSTGSSTWVGKFPPYNGRVREDVWNSIWRCQTQGGERPSVDLRPLLPPLLVGPSVYMRGFMRDYKRRILACLCGCTFTWLTMARLRSVTRLGSSEARRRA